MILAGKGQAGASGEDAVQVPQHGKERLAELESLIGVKFNDQLLLNQALVHRSAMVDNLFSNQRLEFLGDSILGMVVAEQVFAANPSANEGSLSEIRKRVINARALATAGRAMQLGDWIHVADYESKRGGLSQDSLLADAVEAIIAAVYLDQGIEVARGFILSILAETVERASSEKAEELDTKGKLRERIMKMNFPPPEYHLVSVGPVHSPKFTAHVLVGEQRLGYGFGKTKKAAELAAASYSLEIISDMPVCTRLKSLTDPEWKRDLFKATVCCYLKC